jgi:hypothetical protein
MTNKRKAMEEGESIPSEETVSDDGETVGAAAAEDAAAQAEEIDANEVETREETPVLEVHAPHEAVHSWKDVLIHIAIIVVGLLIALGLDEGAQYIHHRREVAEVRAELRAEREANKEAFASEVTHWRWETVELENNLMVLAYIEKHPGTPDEKLPGALVWQHTSAAYSWAAWDAATSSGVTSLMPRDEVAQYGNIYFHLKLSEDQEVDTWNAMNDAFRYQLTDSRLADLSPAQIEETTTLTQIAFTKLWLEGAGLGAIPRMFKDFPPAITPRELAGVHHQASYAELMQNPGYALTIQRMEAAGFVKPWAGAGGGGKR